ncbi:hypothetical protein BJX68DRAFT_276340 [Aspergillus pseudodeflectus]|uniref:Cyclase-domain-containing protein n=1 Tax=Aspergillus pseudodeflectus TaxID=176178 RepID=A0ABR4K7T6_9EURO
MPLQPENYPSFDSLPVDKSGPRGNAWGLWGPEDQLGTLNLLTDELVRRAAAENITIGKRLSLNWSMTAATHPRFSRKPLELRLINKAPLKHAHDDEWTFNSQCSSQWDGFRHYAYQKEQARTYLTRNPSQLYYMGRTAQDFAASPIPNGIQHVSQQGITGRAILIDWYTWAQAQNKSIDATSAHEIPFSELLETLRYQNMDPTSTFRRGDILAIRSGYIAQYTEMSETKRAHLNEAYKTEKPSNIGVKPSEELLRFLWDTGIAAVCGDSRSFEVWPCKAEDEEWHLHEWLLAGWGMPIGELFDLEELARVCKGLRRYTFFLASEPVNVPGAVASPPNALAFF